MARRKVEGRWVDLPPGYHVRGEYRKLFLYFEGEGGIEHVKTFARSSIRNNGGQIIEDAASKHQQEREVA